MSVMESQTQQRPQARPRSKSGFSFRSDKSGSSTKSPKRETLIESHEEKRRTHMSQTTKANPNAAINEMQPIAAALEKPTLGDLRSGSYNDQYGNLITEPDLSNPTRPRWERPLDTIRSFEAAIDAEYKTRQSILRPETATNDGNGGGYSSRRSSTYWGGGYDTVRPRYSTVGAGYYAGSNRDSYVENGNGNGNGNYPPAQQPVPGRYRNSRLGSDPTLNRYSNPAAGIYPAPGYQQSRDTVITGMTGGSGGSGSEPWVSGTDPTSSENSSVDKINPVPKQEYDGQYGYQNYGANPTFRNPIMEEGGYGARGYNGNGMNGANNGFLSQNATDYPPAPPPKMDSGPPVRVPIRLDSAPAIPNGNGGVLSSSSGNKLQRNNTLKKQESTKRKSWFARRFSKQE